jgi:hypothetical protein
MLKLSPLLLFEFVPEALFKVDLQLKGVVVVVRLYDGPLENLGRELPTNDRE